MASTAVIRPPATLPANFNSWDQTPPSSSARPSAQPPKTLPANFFDNQPTSAPSAPASAPPTFTQGHEGEGTYRMLTPQGQQQSVPFSNVTSAQRQGFKLHPDDQARFQHDYIYAPVSDQSESSAGGIGSFLKGAAGEVGNTIKGIGSLVTPDGISQLLDNMDATPSLRKIGNAVAGTASFLANPGKQIGQRMAAGIVDNERAAAHQVRQYTQDAAATPITSPLLKLGNYARAGTTALSMANPLNPAGTAGLNTQIDNGDPAGALGAGLVDAGMIAAPEALPRIGSAARNLLRGDIDAPMPGSTITPRQRYQAAQRVGAQFDAADATDSTPLKIIKRFNRNSLVGAPVYDKVAAQNTAAVRNATAQLQAEMSPLGSREEIGRFNQDQLKQNQASLKEQSNNQFAALNDATGGQPVPGAAEVGKTAQQMLEQERPYFSKYEAFRPGRAMNALEDLGKVDDTTGYDTLQRLRSDTHELTTSNNDLVKNRATGLLQRMTSTLDNAITSKGLTPAQADIFRQANDAWADMKSQYDDPSSPLYHAIRTPNPSELATRIGPQTPEMLENLRPRIGEAGIGALQRGTVDELLPKNNLGEPDLKSFGSRLYKLPESYRNSLFGDVYSGRLDDIARTTQGIAADFNPSGSGKELQKIGEGSAIASSPFGHPVAALPLLQFPVARLMNSPGIVRWLMDEPAGGSSAAAAAGGAQPAPTGALPRIGQRSVTQAEPSRGVLHVDLPAIETPPAAPKPTATPASAQQVEGLDGASTQLHTPEGMMPARYRVLEADSLQPSHSATNFKPNPRYPAGVQERDYFGNRENQLRVIQNAQDYKPELTVTDNPDAINGPPVVTPDGTVLGGNSRIMSTQRLYNGGATTYKDFLKSRAAQFGMDPEDIDQMHEPVLVREVRPQGGIEAQRQLGSLLNRPLTAQMSSAEKAVSLGKGVSPDTLHTVGAMLREVGDGATLRDILSEPSRSHALLMRMQQDGLIGREERPQFVDTSTGGMNEDGKRIFEKALMGSVIGDPQLMNATPKSVLAKLNASVGPLAEIGSRADAWNIMPAVRRALEAHARMAASGMNVADYLNQKSVFEKPMTPIEEHMTRVLGLNQNQVRDMFAQYGRDAQYAVPGQTSFLGPAPHEAFNHAFGAKLTAADLHP